MIFTPLGLSSPGRPGPCRIDLVAIADDRGFFARSLCVDEFAAHGLPTGWVQANTSFNNRAGILRGLHFQREPAAEAKLVRCIHGAIFDVVVDVRAGSPDFGRWISLTLTAANRSTLYIPAGFAHGFQALEPETELLYLHDTMFAPSQQAGLNALDPELGIPWPLEVIGLSARDEALPGLSQMEPMQL